MNLEIKVIRSIGISILMGLMLGFGTMKTKYYFLSPQGPKREITKETYENYFDKTINWQTDYTKFVVLEKELNSQVAVITGLIILGLLLVSTGFLKNRKD